MAAAIVSGDFSVAPPALTDISSALLEYGRSLEDSAHDLDDALEPENRLELEAEYETLKGRKTLSEHRETIARLMAHCDEITKLETCRKSLNTKSITDAKKSLEHDLLMEPFRRSLDQELTVFNVGHKVTLGFSGDQATTYHRAQFVGTDYAAVAEVLSCLLNRLVLRMTG